MIRKKELLALFEELEEELESSICNILDRINKVQENVEQMSGRITHNATRSRDLMNFLGLEFYEEPEKKSEIKIRKKKEVGTFGSTERSRQSSSRMGKKKLR